MKTAVKRKELMAALEEAVWALKGTRVYRGARLAIPPMSIDGPRLHVSASGNDFKYTVSVEAAVPDGAGDGMDVWVPWKEFHGLLKAGETGKVRLDLGGGALRAVERSADGLRVLGEVALLPAPENRERDKRDDPGLLIARYRTRDAFGRLYMALGRAAGGAKGRVRVAPEVFTGTADAVDRTDFPMICARSLSVPGIRAVIAMGQNHDYQSGEFVIAAESGVLYAFAENRSAALRAPSAPDDLVDAEGETQAVSDD